jgi:hypothetical protein
VLRRTWSRRLRAGGAPRAACAVGARSTVARLSSTVDTVSMAAGRGTVPRGVPPRVARGGGTRTFADPGVAGFVSRTTAARHRHTAPPPTDRPRVTRHPTAPRRTGSTARSPGTVLIVREGWQDGVIRTHQPRTHCAGRVASGHPRCGAATGVPQSRSAPSIAHRPSF